jgi:AcrR family transcriptional regulator
LKSATIAQMKNQQTHIIQTAGLLFAQSGIRSNTMDDIARQCGVSKKVLYEHFANKAAVVRKVVEVVISGIEQHIRISAGIAPNAAMEMMNHFRHVQEYCSQLTPRFIWDLKKRYPEEYGLLQRLKDEKVVPFIGQNLLRGIEEGIYRSDINMNLASWLYSWQLENCFEKELPYAHSRGELLKCINCLFLRGILSAKGHKLLLNIHK